MKVLNKVKALVLVGATFLMLGLANPVSAADSVWTLDGDSGAGSSDCSALLKAGKPAEYTNCMAQQTGSKTDLQGTLKGFLQLIIGIIGLLAVIMIIYGGIQYTMSAGDTGKVTKAKNTILYGIVGLVIALLAFAIVSFVLQNV